MEPWGSKKVSFLGFGRRFFEDEDERQEVIMEYIEKDDEESYYYEEEVIDEDDEFYIDSPVRKYRSLASSQDPPQDDEKIRSYDEDYPDDEEPPRISPVPILRDSLGSNSGDEEPPEHKPAPLPTKPLDPLPSSEVKSKPSSKKFSSSRIMTAASTRYSSMKSSKMDPDTPAYDPPQTLVIQPFKPRFSPRYSSDGCFDDISDILSSKDDATVNDASTLDTKSSKSLTSSKNKSAIVSVAKSKTKRVKMKERQLVSRKLDRYTPIDSMSQIIERSSTFFDPERAVEPQLELEEDIDRKRKRTTRRGFYWFLIFVLTLAIIFATTYLVIYILRLLRSDDNMYVNLGGDDNISAIDSNFVGSKPTTGMDPYTPGSCDFGLNYTQPHVSQQCFCGGKIAVLARDVREKYYSLKMLFSDLKVSEVWEFPEESCDPRNQALVWLATTYTRDKVDLIQKYVLSSLYFAAKGEQWTNSDQWLEHLDVCFWSGVSCNDMGQVTGLSLDSNKLEGEIPEELGLLAHLEVISLRNNGLIGTIPEAIISIPNIREISLTRNNITGTISDLIGEAVNLETLRLDLNQMNGPINTELGKLVQLKKLVLGFNQFTGSFPSQLLQLTSLTDLNIQSNADIIGRLPSGISTFSDLESLSLANTQISGTIPNEMMMLANLARLNLSGCRFRQGIPSRLGRLTELNYLNLSHNQLTGFIPSELSRLTQLVHLSLKGNQLYGEVPDSLGKLTQLDALSLEDNALTGRVPEAVCDLRLNELIMFTTDCSRGSSGLLCPIPSCCTSCL